MKKLLKEPLLHFVLIGAVFFLLYSWVGTDQTEKGHITIDESDLDEIVSKFDMQWKRAPTEAELIAIVAKRVEEEVFYQEALLMNLDHNDEIIKRRLSQKMQSLSNDIASVIEPTDKELQAHYKNHSDRYMQEASFTLYQVFFSPDKRNNWRKDAELALPSIQQMNMEDALQIGDAIALPKVFKNTTEFHIERQMGSSFTQALKAIETGSWSGPIESGYGAHLVYIESKEEEKVAPFATVKKQVLEDLNFDKQQEVQSQVYKSLEKKYTIEIDVNSALYSEDFINRMKTEIRGN